MDPQAIVYIVVNDKDLPMCLMEDFLIATFTSTKNLEDFFENLGIDKNEVKFEGHRYGLMKEKYENQFNGCVVDPPYEMTTQVGLTCDVILWNNYRPLHAEEVSK